jgi:hypothetical protein
MTEKTRVGCPKCGSLNIAVEIDGWVAAERYTYVDPINGKTCFDYDADPDKELDYVTGELFDCRECGCRFYEDGEEE